MKLTEAEWKLMNALWKGHPASARDILERLEGQADWAYTTIKTMLTRLEEKGALTSTMKRNAALYEPVLTRRKARRQAMRALMDSAFDGAFGSMLHFLVSDENLSDKDTEELLRLLKEKKGRQPHDVADQ